MIYYRQTLLQMYDDNYPGEIESSLSIRFHKYSPGPLRNAAALMDGDDVLMSFDGISTTIECSAAGAFKRRRLTRLEQQEEHSKVKPKH